MSPVSAESLTPHLTKGTVCIAFLTEQEVSCLPTLQDLKQTNTASACSCTHIIEMHKTHSRSAVCQRDQADTN